MEVKGEAGFCNHDEYGGQDGGLCRSAKPIGTRFLRNHNRMRICPDEARCFQKQGWVY